MSSPVSCPGTETGSGKGLLSTKNAEKNSEDAEAKVVAQGQKQDLGKDYYQQRIQRTTVRMLRPRY